ncbi:AAA family ATPase [Arthrobacter sp. I2-34]|uniref:AAA family ATPase n=1 Tax=Arthrobacter hankyongi TaxID=2904801 RepID=A0ABS9L4K3_9MICC|nr:AAA family ATPase [Arthrobacter hankyongi]MCG2621612.1 AAA family ATPase [Arthrobacter hankyongi]
MSRFILITAAPDFEGRLRQAMSGSLAGTLQVLPPEVMRGGTEAIVPRDSSQGPEVLFLGPGLDLPQALELARTLDLKHPEISLVLVADSSHELALAAMQAGVRDVLAPAADDAELRQLLERACLAAASRRRGLSMASEPMDAPARVIAVMSPKGGVGKTTVATNLAIGLGKVAPQRVVIVDLDLQFGDVGSGLLLEPERTITDAVQGSAARDAMVLKTFLTAHSSGIYALCAPRLPGDADLITPEHVSRLIRQLALEFKYIVVDTAPGLGEHCLATLEQATDGVWVCGMDVPSIRGLRTGFGVLQELGLMPDGRHVVLNFADRKSGLSVQDIEATIGVPVDVVVPRSRTVPFSTNRGVPLLQDNTRDSATKGLRRLVQRFDPAKVAEAQKQLHRRVVVS